jgi:hypothetical protein
MKNGSDVAAAIAGDDERELMRRLVTFIDEEAQRCRAAGMTFNSFMACVVNALGRMATAQVKNGEVTIDDVLGQIRAVMMVQVGAMSITDLPMVHRNDSTLKN